MKIIEKLLEIIYPSKCAICNKTSKNSICKNCYRNIASKCKIKKYKNKYYDMHLYLYKHEGIIRNKIIAYKFNDKSYLHEFFSQLILKNEKVCCLLKSYDIIIPVPIHKKRMKNRGYNQTSLIARDISNKIQGLLFENNVLRKQIHTKAQSTLNKFERSNNIVGTYKVTNKQKIENKRIVLLDDVYTTGNTANECSKILKENGAKDICVLTITKD